jgi:alkanesulfonate monooxygenase SsuD/methylene tetrahydromethanopterin reductase-like flavin-dependent oxidoreductase (luciferase family)
MQSQNNASEERLPVKFGITTNYVWSGPPITEIARHIEALGFESMWMGEHTIIPAAAAGAVRAMACRCLRTTGTCPRCSSRLRRRRR